MVTAAVTGGRRSRRPTRSGPGRGDRDPVGGAGPRSGGRAPGNAADTRPMPATSTTTDDHRRPPATDRPAARARRRAASGWPPPRGRSRLRPDLRRDRFAGGGRRRLVAIGAVGAVAVRPRPAAAGPDPSPGSPRPGAATTAIAANHAMIEYEQRQRGARAARRRPGCSSRLGHLVSPGPAERGDRARHGRPAPFGQVPAVDGSQGG